MKYLGIFMFLTGAILVLTATVGHWTSIGNYESTSPRKWERYDPGLASSINSFPTLAEAAKKQVSASSGDREAMDVLYAIVTDRFTHMEARHGFFGNWLLYFAGKIHPAFSHIWNADGLMRGHSLLCDQSSYLLLRLALANGIKARHVGLGGHVVMEAWYDSDWHLYDPDLEVVPMDSAGQVLSVEKLALNTGLLNKYYGPHGVAGIIGSRDDNTYVSYPEGARYEWKSNVLAYFERGMEVLKFIIPIVLIGVGIGLAMRPEN